MEKTLQITSYLNVKRARRENRQKKTQRGRTKNQNSGLEWWRESRERVSETGGKLKRGPKEGKKKKPKKRDTLAKGVSVITPLKSCSVGGAFFQVCVFMCWVCVWGVNEDWSLGNGCAWWGLKAKAKVAGSARKSGRVDIFLLLFLVGSAEWWEIVGGGGGWRMDACLSGNGGDKCHGQTVGKTMSVEMHNSDP